jgi:hypothetical protein
VIGGRLWAAPANSIVGIDLLSTRVSSRTAFPTAYFNDLLAGNGALWAWDVTTNRIDELRAS